MTDYPSPNFFEKLLLLFVKVEFVDVTPEFQPFTQWRVLYKTLFGKTFFIGEFMMPPVHVNCKCSCIEEAPHD